MIEANYFGSAAAAASLDRFKTRVATLFALAAVFLASAAAKRSLTDMVRGWGRPNSQMCTFSSNQWSLFLQSPSDLQFHI